MRQNYIPPREAYRKLKLATEMRTSVYLYGATGYGKTRLVQEFLGKRKAVWLNAPFEEIDLNELLASATSEKQLVVVADDLHLLQDEKSKNDLLALAKHSEIQLIMMGRMMTPLWMVPLITAGNLIVIPEENLHLDKEEISKIAEKEQVDLPAEMATFLAEGTVGNAYIVATALQLMKSGVTTNQELWDELGNMFAQHLEEEIIPKWDTALQEFLMQVSVVDSFTLPLAVMITGDDRAAAMLEQAQRVGNFLTKSGDVYTIRFHLVKALRNLALKELGLNNYKSCLNRAGLYYETQGDIPNALKYYKESEDKENIRALLIRNGRRHIGDGYFYELKQYYLALSEEEVETSPILMSSLSMLYSVMMNAEESEYWYDKLKVFAKNAKGGDKREANEMLLYLEIGLPHRGNVNMLEVMKRAVALMGTGGIKIPELSVTSNMPSTMNGGKDFCDWSKKDQMMADLVGKMVEKVLGSFGRGLIHAALAESFYEKGGKDEEVIHHALLAQMEVEGGGKLEMNFAAVGIQVRLSLLNGKVTTAIQMLESFEERVRQAGKTELLPNIRALRCRIALLNGDTKTIEDWMQEAPNEMVEFWPPERYRYITKVKCYLTDSKNESAIFLLEKLRYYAKEMSRTYLYMETGLLLAIAYRREKREWKALLTDTLLEITEYQFVRLIAEKGAGILPLLKEVKKDYEVCEGADMTWFVSVLKETTSQAERYPGYLNAETAQPSDFSEVALTVLRMQAEGLSIREIGMKLDMAERTVKYHASENYRKLGAKGKTDAVQIARGMNLI